MNIPQGFSAAKILSPRRKTTQATTIEALATEQLEHFGLSIETEYGKTLFNAATHLYQAQQDIHSIWQITCSTIQQLDKADRAAYFNAKKFLSFQIAKLLDTLQNPLRKTYQSLEFSDTSQYAKGQYPLFDNISAIFSATPVIVRTATYIYACTEWVDDAFHGKEPTHQIYSRLLNPTSISLANAIVDLEAGPHSSDYLAWNFNSGMAAIDALFANVFNYGDVVIVSRNIYGGVYQLLQDYYARPEKFNLSLEWFDGYSSDEFEQFLSKIKNKHSQTNKKIHVYIESPCNPHGYVLDVPGICKAAHQHNHLVMLDSTLATPVLFKPLQRQNKFERPDYVVHSYTKDISGSGACTAGVVIGEVERMFCPKDSDNKKTSWAKTMFWDVYYIKGAFLDSDKAFEVINGMKTLEHRMIKKCINTAVITYFLSSHPDIQVNSHAVPSNSNHSLKESLLSHGLPCPLFTIDFEKADINYKTFVRFFDALEPGFSHMVSIGQSNTMVLCPALTSHSELSKEALQDAQIFPSTIRFSIGDENVKELIAHLIHTMKRYIDPEREGFSQQFMPAQSIETFITQITTQVHQQLCHSGKTLEEMLDTNFTA